MSAMRRLIPLFDRVLVEKIVAPAKSAGGVLLPENAASKMHEGKVVATGPGRRLPNGDISPVSVKEGDRVLLPEFGGQPIKLHDKEFTLYRDEELLGLLKE